MTIGRARQDFVVRNRRRLARRFSGFWRQLSLGRARNRWGREVIETERTRGSDYESLAENPLTGLFIICHSVHSLVEQIVDTL